MQIVSPLLQWISYSPLEREGSVALIHEFQIADSLDPPFLVSGASAPLVWVEKKPRSGALRAALVQSEGKDFGDVFRSILRNLIERGQRYEYGNVHPLSREGVLSAMSYLESFGIPSVELLVSPGYEGEKTFGEVEVKEVSWAPEGALIAIPEDKGYLGDLHWFGNVYCIVVHNPSRGIAVAMDKAWWDPEDDTGRMAKEHPGGELRSDGEG